MSDQNAVYLTADDDSGQSYLLSDPAALQRDVMILADPAKPRNLFMVKTADFLDRHHVTVERPAAAPAKRRRFGRKEKCA
jgi:hypothetical protein